MFLAASTNLKLRWVEMRRDGAANAKREQTSIRVYTYNLSSGAPSCTVSTSTNMPGLAGTGRGGYVCHFFHFDGYVRHSRFSVRFTEERDTSMPSCRRTSAPRS